MNEAEIWVYLGAAFSVGLGLGWWLFSGSSRPASGSAASAKDRANAALDHTPDPEQAEALERLEQALRAARDELATARAATEAAEQERSRAEQERSRAEHEARGERSRIEKLQANLDQTRQARDTYKDEVDRARRTIHQLERAADAATPTAALSFAPAPDAPSAPPSPPSPPPEADLPASPFRTPPPMEGPTEMGTVPAALVTTPRIEPPPPPRRRPRGPIDVLFGPLGGVPLTPSARSIPWELTVRLGETDDAPSRLRAVQVTLRFDLEDEGISVNGRRRGPLTLSRGATITPSRPLHIQVGLSTGVHSDTPEADRPPAVPGDHKVVIVVQYHVDTSRGAPESARFSARIPVVPSR